VICQLSAEGSGYLEWTVVIWNLFSTDNIDKVGKSLVCILPRILMTQLEFLFYNCNRVVTHYFSLVNRWCKIYIAVVIMFLFTCGWLLLFLALTVLDNPLLGIKIATEKTKVCLFGVYYLFWKNFEVRIINPRKDLRVFNWVSLIFKVWEGNPWSAQKFVEQRKWSKDCSLCKIKTRWLVSVALYWR
jgi:hypothetical protein